MSGRTYMVLMLGLLGLQVAIVFGSLADQQAREQGFYASGYSAGWDARQHLVDNQNASLRNVGLCRYADLACGGRK